MDKRIIINETDATTSSTALGSTDVVYVPGFSYYPEEVKISEKVSAYYGKVGEPVLCTSLTQFKEQFGDKPAYFKTDQYYPVFEVDATGKAVKSGFGEWAIPPKQDAQDENGTVMFAAYAADPSYMYACELLSKGIPVIYERLNKLGVEADNCDISVETFYTEFIKALTETDLGVERTLLTSENLPIKYLTSGGYPTFEYYDMTTGILVQQMTALAVKRGDVIALIDHTNYPTRKLYGGTPQQPGSSVFANIQGQFQETLEQGTYAAMITPWANYTLESNITQGDATFDGNFPGSFAYLACLANVIRTNPSWSTIAGVIRGNVPMLNKLCTDKVLTNAIANAYQPDPYDDEEKERSNNTVCINAITNIKGYGHCIWGNRTLRPQVIGAQGYALNFLNIRNLICDIKKAAYDVSVSLMFEPNSMVLWGNFKGALTPTLDKMKATQGIADYQIVKLESNTKTKLAAQINIYPMYSVEKFKININITDEEVNVA